MLLFGYHKEFFEERDFFKKSKNKNPSKITCYMVYNYLVLHISLSAIVLDSRD